MNPPKLLTQLTAALIALPLMAQDAGVPQKHKVRFNYDATEGDFAVVLLAADDAMQAFGRQQILAAAPIYLVLHKVEDRFVADGDLPADWRGELFAQRATYSPAHGLQLGPVANITAPRPNVDAWPVKPAPIAELGDVDRQATEPVPEGEIQAAKPDLKDGGVNGEELAPIELKFEPGDAPAGTPAVLLARFVARTDGYGLTLVRIAQDDSGEAVDVFLYRKLPGKGEGMRDVVEEHTVLAELPAGVAIRVLLAEGTEKEPQDGHKWAEIARLKG